MVSVKTRGRKIDIFLVIIQNFIFNPIIKIKIFEKPFLVLKKIKIEMVFTETICQREQYLTPPAWS